MLKHIRTIGVVTLVTVLTVAGLAAFSWVQPAAAAEAQTAALNGDMGRGGLCGDAGREAAAAALGITTDELSTQLRAGKSLSDLAAEAGVDAQTVQDAVTAACQEASQAAIEQAVTDGTITREHADWLLEGLEKGYWGAGSSGSFGFGPHGFGGGVHRPSSEKPAATPSASDSGA